MSIPSSERAVIIGAGQAGLQAAVSLRQARFAGEIALIGAETALPYQRPPLSKAYLKGELDLDRLLLRPQSFFDQQNIATELGVAVAAIDRKNKTLRLADGRETSYSALLIATGAPPRRLDMDGARRPGVYYLRTLNDSDSLRAILETNGRIVIVGGGYIGLEVAAVARAAGRDVTVLEMADRVLSRVAGPETSAYFHDLHAGHGVDLRVGARLAALDGAGDDDPVSAAVLADGEKIPCAAVVIGVGATPESHLAAEAGLKVENGVWVDETARTEDRHIWAAGDVANFPSGLYGRRMRLESVPNAIEQAKIAAANIAGGALVYDAVPWFWSDQYDVKLQTAGCPSPNYDQVVRQGASARSRSVWYFDGDRLMAVDAMNEPAAFLIAKRLLGDGARLDREKVADPAVDLKSLAG
ncbi:MAG: FAD-dependent oxidoreductase [Pseudomonadota bacterium]